VWRGSSTGGSLGRGADPYKNRRVKLCLRAQELPELCDARITRVVDCAPEMPATLASMGIIGDWLDPPGHLTHRYLLSIDGWAAEWDGLVWKLASGSTVLIVESAWEQWYEDRLVPWRHYVPVRADLGDLEERLLWCRAHDDECRAIAERAQRLMQSLSFEEAARFTASRLSALVSSG
jgi:hypothetical protein